MKRYGDTPEYVQTMKRVQETLDELHLPYPPELCNWLQTLQERDKENLDG